MSLDILKSLKDWQKTILTHPWFRGGILAIILAVFGGLFAIIGLKLLEPSSLSKLLPGEPTAAYVEFDLTQYANAMSKSSPQFPFDFSKIQDFLSLTQKNTTKTLPSWVKNKAGIAWLQTNSQDLQKVIFLENDPKKTPPLTDFPSSSSAMVQKINKYLVFSSSKEVFQILNDVQNGITPNLKHSADFIKLRPNLPYDSMSFGYLKTAKLNHLLQIDSLKTNPFFSLATDIELGLRPYFPALGFALNPYEKGLSLQTYWVGDKNKFKNQALFDLNKKYNGSLLSYLPQKTNLVIGGEDFSSLLSQIKALLETNDSGKGSMLTALLQSWFENYWGNIGEAEKMLAPLFSNEYLLGLIPFPTETNTKIPVSYDSGFLLGLTINSEEEKIANNLLDILLNRGIIKIDQEQSSIGKIALEKITRLNSKIPYDVIQLKTGKILFQIMIYKNMLFFSLDEKIMQQVADLLTNNEENYTTSESFQELKNIMSSANFVVDFSNQDVLQSQYGLNQIISSFNLFDDGGNSLHLLEF